MMDVREGKRKVSCEILNQRKEWFRAKFAYVSVMMEACTIN